jgi:DNA-binding GntR family transcriptional regulator
MAKPAISKQERAYRYIREQIEAGALGPGSRLVAESIARELDMSPVPIREAIRRLEAEGWVLYEHNIGARVTPIDLQQWKSLMHSLAIVEGAVTALAAPNLEETDLRRLVRLNQQMAKAVAAGDALKSASSNLEFHDVIYQRCPNAWLLRLLRSTNLRLDSVRRSVFVFIPERTRDSVGEHERLVAMIRAAEPAEAIEREARAHKLRTMQAYEAHWDSVAPREGA